MLMLQSIAPAIILKNGRKETTLEVLQLMVKVGQVCCYVKEQCNLNLCRA